MITDDIDESRHLPMTEMPEDEDPEDTSKTDQIQQEFAHSKGQYFWTHDTFCFTLDDSPLHVVL